MSKIKIGNYDIDQCVIDWFALVTKRIGWTIKDADDIDMWELWLLQRFYDDPPLKTPTQHELPPTFTKTPQNLTSEEWDEKIRIANDFYLR